MNYRGFIKFIFVFISFISSVIFMFVTNKSFSIHYISTALLFCFGIIDYILIMFKNKHYDNKSIYFISVIVAILFFYHVYNIVHEYISFQSFSFDISWYYLFILVILMIDSLFDIKRESSFLNDVLTIIVCLIISLVHYRYYLEPNFIHNMVKLPDMSSFGIGLQDSYFYVTKYYVWFLYVLIVIFIHKKTLNICNKKM